MSKNERKKRVDGFSEFQAVLWMSIIYVVVRIKKLFAKLFFLLFVPGHHRASDEADLEDKDFERGERTFGF